GPGLTRRRGAPIRAMARSSYRQVHLLALTVPQWFAPPAWHPNAAQLRRDYAGHAVDGRVLLFGVQLRDRLIGRGGLRAAVDSAMESLATGEVPISDFDADFAQVDAALTRAGLLAARSGDISMANAWFNYGLTSDPMMAPDVDSLTVFSHPSAARYARDRLEGVPQEKWPALEGAHTLSFGAVQELGLEYVPSNDYRAMWGLQLLDAGAAAV